MYAWLQNLLYLKVVVGVVEVLVWQGGRWGEEEVDVWAPGLELWGHQAGSQQEALWGKDIYVRGKFIYFKKVSRLSDIFPHFQMGRENVFLPSLETLWKHAHFPQRFLYNFLI